MQDDEEITPMGWGESVAFWAIVGSPFAAVVLGTLLAGWLR